MLKQKFNKYLEELKKKIKNKSIVVYGTGKIFQEVQKNYDLTNLNIIGVMDKKYVAEDEGKLDFGYPILSDSKLKDIDADVILIAVEKYLSIEKNFKKLYPEKIILPLVKAKFSEIIKHNLNQTQLVKKYLRSKNNTVVLIKKNGEKIYSPKIKNLEIKWTGTNNYIEIHEPFTIKEKVSLQCKNDNKVIIEQNNIHKRSEILMGSKNYLYIGKNTTVENVMIHMFSANNQNLVIGNDCMFSWDITIRTSDAHTIYDKDTRKIINQPKDVSLGNHVWVAAKTTILKGAKIASNCMVGTGSIVNKEFNEENCMIAGAPAKVIKRNINWDRKGHDDFVG